VAGERGWALIGWDMSAVDRCVWRRLRDRGGQFVPRRKEQHDALVVGCASHFILELNMIYPFSKLAALTAAMTVAATSVSAQDAMAVSALQAPEAREGDYAEVNGARIFYEARGDGPPVVLLHGYPLSGALFARMRDGLEDEHTVITLDHRGYGLSEAPETPDSVVTYAEDALAVMDKLGIEQAAIGGMSMGGPIVFEMFRQAPDRFSSMLLIDTIAAPASPAEAGLWQGMADMVRSDGVEAIIPALLPDMLTGQTRQDQPEVVEYLTAVMEGASKDAAIGGAVALADRPDSTPTLEEIEVPTLVLVGLADPVYSFEIAQSMVDAIGDNAELAIIPGASHAAVFEAPAEAAAAVVQFLSASGDN